MHYYYQLHDLIREFLIPKAREENIFTIHSGTKTSYSSNNLERRVVILSKDVQTKNISSNIRSLLVAGRVGARINCSSFKLLRVLDFGDFSGPDDDDGQCLTGLTNLRYLKCHSNNGINPSYLTCFNSLEMVFALLNCENSSLPENFWDYKMLRYVDFLLYRYCIPSGPPSTAKLENLLTLGFVVARREWSSKLPHFPRLRKLKISIHEEFEWEPFTQRLCVLEELKSFFCWADTEVPVVHITPAFANFKCLQRLYLDGKWPEEATIDFTMLPPNLVRLTLRNAKLKKDPLPELEKLQHLQELDLFGNMYVGRTMACSKGGFLCLQKLNVACCDVDEWNIEDGAMPNINWLSMYEFKNLQMVPNFQHLTNLRRLDAGKMSPQFKLKLEGEDRYKVNNIPIFH